MFYYVNTDFKFFWPPYSRIDLQNDTATIFVNDFFTQNLNSFDRVGYALTHHIIGWDDSRRTLFNENYLKYALLCLTEYPLILIKPSENQTDLKYFNPNPWYLIDKFANVNIEELVSLFREKFPAIKVITCSPNPCEAILSTCSKESPLIIGLAKTGIKVLQKSGSTACIKEEFHDKYMPSEFVLNDEEIQSLLNPVELIIQDPVEKDEPENLQNKTPEELRNIIQQLKSSLRECDDIIMSLQSSKLPKKDVSFTPSHNNQAAIAKPFINKQDFANSSGKRATPNS